MIDKDKILNFSESILKIFDLKCESIIQNEDGSLKIRVTFTANIDKNKIDGDILKLLQREEQEHLKLLEKNAELHRIIDDQAKRIIELKKKSIHVDIEEQK
ncbi:MAG: hypothetical protein IJ728_01785 [Selenomonadaceae bacterium]|nr:hypothetical protein [Selenomonadaceae bacterium]